MKKYSGIILILITFLLTYIFWTLEITASQLSYRQYSQFIASLALIAFTWINYISSRHYYVDKIFNGLDKSYIYHKYLSILAIIFIWVHNFTLKMGNPSGGRPSGIKTPTEGFKPPSGFTDSSNSLFSFPIPGKLLASWSMYIFTALVIFFIVAYKLEYQRWKILHKLMIIPYVFGLIHYYLNSSYGPFTSTAYNIWMNLMNLIGIFTILYSVFLYEITAFKYKYEITALKKVSRDTIELTGVSKTKGMQYNPGQFAFMKVLGKNKTFPSHPFTMCQTYKPGEIQFAIKSLGDHTSKLEDNLVIGDIIALSGPFGKFNYKFGLKHQIWLAGGIGVTPFRSFWQTEIPSDYTIDLFYAYNNEEEGSYVDELKNLETRNNLKVHLIDASKRGFLESEDFEKCLNKDYQYDVFFCGPKAMREKAKKDLKKAMFKVRNLHYEHFKFK